MAKRLPLYLFLFFSFHFIPLHSQKAKSDSIYKLWAASPKDRQLIRNFIIYYRKWNADSALAFGNAALAKAQNTNDQALTADWMLYNASTLDAMDHKQEAVDMINQAIVIYKSINDTVNLDDADNSLGLMQIRMLHFKEAKICLEEANQIRERQKDTVGLAGNNLNLGYLYGTMGDYPLALEYYFKSLDYARLAEAKDPSYLGKVLNNIGSIYMDQKKYDDALSFFRQSLSYKARLGNKNDMASTYNNIGSNFMEQNFMDSAFHYYEIALNLREQTGDVRGQGIVHNNLGQVYEAQEQYTKAEAEYRKALALRESILDNSGVIGSLNSLGELLCKIKKTTEGLADLRRAYQMSVDAGGLNQRMESSLALAKGLQSSGYFEEGLKYAIMAIDLKDSVLNNEAAKNSAELKAKYDMDLQAKELEKAKAQQKETDIRNEAERSRNRTVLISGSILALLTILFFYIRIRETRKARAVLQRAYTEIESKNKSITDSINYAKHIQLAILPEMGMLKKIFPESFVFYKPKDIVSGDFYWIHPTENRIWFAVADCTGHGVPGAFMSVLSSSQLTSAVTESPEAMPSSILKKIDREIQRQLHQDSSGSGSRDGMDIALCCFDPRKRELVYAGANRPVIIYRNKGELEFMKPVKRAVGGNILGDDAGTFTDHSCTLEKDEVIFLYSDGYPDQFGGPKGKKFKSAQFRDMLVKMTGANMDETGRELEKMFNDWKGSLEQVDDVCVLGIKP